MSNGDLNWIAGFIWGIADDVLRDVYSRGKYRDVILPMTVIRRLDAVLEPAKEAVLRMKVQLDAAGIANQDAALQQASGEAFYNTSNFTLRDLTRATSSQRLKADVEAYLDGFSPNVQDILAKFEFRNHMPRLVNNDCLGPLIEKFLDPRINLSPRPALTEDGGQRLPGLDNHAMGTIFEELIRRFNEENNDEAGEHWTPRDVVKLMANLVFAPIADEITSGTYLVYDGACGTGGMLTVAEETLAKLASEHGKEVSVHLFGQEINPETYAIAKADLLLKGEGSAAEQIRDRSTLADDAFASRRFDFMLSNPPYGKSWKNDLERMGGKRDLADPRFVFPYGDDPAYSLITRSSDGQMMFLANKLSKMKHDTPLGSRIAEVHNGSSLFTGDAGSGESNIRRWIIENDWLEAIIALPLNIFYNTGIATYVWVLTNRKPVHRQGKIQLINATQWFVPLRKNLGSKNCELAVEHIAKISDSFLAFQQSEESKIFNNEDFGYWKLTIERPLRLSSQFTKERVQALRYGSGDEELRRELYLDFGDALYDDFGLIKRKLEQMNAAASAESDDAEDEADEPKARSHAIPEKRMKKLTDRKTWERDRRLLNAASALHRAIGDRLFPDHNEFCDELSETTRRLDLRLSVAERKLLQRAMSWRDPDAPPVIARTRKPSPDDDEGHDRLYGRYRELEFGKPVVVEYEPDTQLRDTEQVPLQEPGGVEAFFKREVLPHVADAWIDASKTEIGYEISFARYFYKPEPLRTLVEIETDIRALERETENMLDEITAEAAA